MTAVLLAVATSMFVGGCAQSGAAAVPEICPDSAAARQAQAIAEAAHPAIAAGVYASWMADAPLSRLRFAHEMYVALRHACDSVRPGGGAAFDRSLDSIHASAEPLVRARMMALSASPERVASALRADTAELHAVGPLMPVVYEADSTLLSRYLRAINQQPICTLPNNTVSQ